MSLLEPFGKIFLKGVRANGDLLGFLWVHRRAFLRGGGRATSCAAESLSAVTWQVFSLWNQVFSALNGGPRRARPVRALPDRRALLAPLRARAFSLPTRLAGR